MDGIVKPAASRDGAGCSVPMRKQIELPPIYMERDETVKPEPRIEESPELILRLVDLIFFGNEEPEIPS